jgi:hypothetical protein
LSFEYYGYMRIFQFSLVVLFACLFFLASFVGTRVAQHKEMLTNPAQAVHIVDDLVYAVTVGVPASIPNLKFELSHASLPELTHAVLHSVRHGEVPSIIHVTSVASTQIEADKPEPIPRSELLTGMLESQGKPLFASKRMLEIASARASDTILANISAEKGGIVRFADGSYFAIAPHYLTSDIGVSVAMSSPALPDATLLDAASSAMLISFKPVNEGIDYARPAPGLKTGAIATIALSAQQKKNSLDHMVVFVKRVFLSDGTSADFEETPNMLRHFMTADLTTDHVLKFSAHVNGIIMVSLQRVKSNAVVGFAQ